VAAGLMADGIFHLGSTVALGIGLEAGTLNLHDGVVQHKLVGYHQVQARRPTPL
jgi:uncharacterized membrane protein